VQALIGRYRRVHTAGRRCHPRACPTPLEASDGGTYVSTRVPRYRGFFLICPRTDQIQLRAKVAKISTKLVNPGPRVEASRARAAWQH
jgi:hypothetical protein